MPPRDHNAFPIEATQTCRTWLQTEPIKSDPRYKVLRYMLEQTIDDLKPDQD